jgi:DNA-binding transcriptional MerR regulator
MQLQINTMYYFTIYYICIAMAKLQQLQFAFDFDAPIQSETETTPIVEQEPIVVNENPIDVTVEANISTVNEAPIEVTETTKSTQGYVIKKPQTETELYNNEVLEKHSNTKRGRKSIKAMEAEADLINIPPDEELFAKQYYPMSVVTQMFNVNHSLLRYWESEFSILQPRKNRKGDRLFRPEDIKNLEIIYHLLRVKKYTIDGAKDYFKNQKQVAKKFEALQQLEQVKQFLLQVKANLS